MSYGKTIRVKHAINTVQEFSISREEVIDGTYNDIFQRPLLIIDLFESMCEHYNNELNSHTRYYHDYQKKIESGMNDEHILKLMEWQKQNKEALEKLLAILFDSRLQFEKVLTALEVFHTCRGFKERDYPWRDYRATLHKEGMESEGKTE